MGKKADKLKKIAEAAAASKPMMASFDAGSSTRRMARWNLPRNESLNRAILREGELIRDRSRDAVRKSPYATNAKSSFIANSVGAGIKPSSLHADPAIKAAIHEAWLQWTDEADADGLTDFYGLQAMAAGSMFEAGEVLVRFRPRRVEDGLSVPLQLQMLDPEHLPLTLNVMSDTGNPIRAGIEFDQIGRRVAYWLYPQHPGDIYIGGGGSLSGIKPIPADQVLHLFNPIRPGQVRGIPHISSALLKLYELDKFDDAALMKAQVAAMFAGFITKPDPDGTVLNEVGAIDPGVGEATLESGTMQVLLPGEAVTFNTPPDMPGYKDFMGIQLHAVAAGMGVTYEQLTGDLTGVNYSSIRAGLVEFRRKIEQFQHMVLVFQFCRPVFNRWLTDAVLAGRLTLPGFAKDAQPYRKIKWITPKFDWVDPMKDRLAEKLAVDNGFKSRSDVIEAEGYDPEENDARIAADKARETKLGLIFPHPVATERLTETVPNADPNAFGQGGR